MEANKIHRDKDTLLNACLPFIIFLVLSLLERQFNIFSLEGKLNISFDKVKNITIFLGSIYILFLGIYIKVEKNKRRILYMIIYMAYLTISSLFVKEYMYYDFISIKLLFKVVYGPLGIVLDPLTFLFEDLNNIYRAIIIFHFFFFVLIGLLRKYFGITKKTVNWFPYIICYFMCLSSLIGGIENSKVHGFHIALIIAGIIGWLLYFMKYEMSIKTKKLWLLIGIMISLFFLYGCGSSNSEQLYETEVEIIEENLEEKTLEDKDQKREANEEKKVPTKKEVLELRNLVTKGMTEEEISRLRENIKVANLTMEKAYLYDSLFERLEDPEDLYWNYVDYKGDIQIGWDLSEKHYVAASGLTRNEWGEKYGKPIMVYNRFHADNFIALMEEMRDSIYHEILRDDFNILIEKMQMAKETHDVNYMIELYRILHDMDYFLLRYGPEDVGKYTMDDSTVNKFYGVLLIHNDSSGDEK